VFCYEGDAKKKVDVVDLYLLSVGEIGVIPFVARSTC
jgi:hypothetical protein